MMSNCASSANIFIPGNLPFRINLTYFVDQRYGDDATGEQDNPLKPYKTIGAPSAIAIPNSIVYVHPGDYQNEQIQLRQDVAWYFEEGAKLFNVSFFGGTRSAIVGHAIFNNDIPVLDYFGTGDIMFEADAINYGTPDHAFLIHGSGMVSIKLTNMLGNAIRAYDSQVNIIYVGVYQNGANLFRLDDTSSGHLLVKVADSVNSNNSMLVFSNNIDITYEGQSAICQGPYFIDIQDNPTAIASAINMNMTLDRLECFGLIHSIGIPTVTDVLKQPSINLHISTIESLNNPVPNPIIDLSYTFCNLIYNRLSFAYLVPIRAIINLGDITVITVNGAQTLNFDQSITGQVGFLLAQATNLTIANLNLTEVFLTWSMIETSGPATVYLSIINLTNIVQDPNTIGILNNSQMGLFVRNSTIIYPDNSFLWVNNGDMFIESDNLQFFSNGSQFITNNGRLQTRIGRIISDGNGNTFVTSNGLSGFTIGTITMIGVNNIGLNVTDQRATMNIGQIDGSAQPGNIGIRVIGNSQLLGSVLAIRTQDNYCLFMDTIGQLSDIRFSVMSASAANPALIQIQGNTNAIMTGDYITTSDSKFAINLENVGYTQLNIGRFDIVTCAVGVRIAGGQGCRCSLNVKDFNIQSDATLAGVWVENGFLNASGNYNINTTTTAGIFLVNNESTLFADLGNSAATFYNLVTDSFTNIWYSAKRSIVLDPTGYNVLCNLVNPVGSPTLTLDGPFLSQGQSNFSFQGGNNPAITRVLNPYLVSNSRNIDAGSNPTLTFFCNYGVGNAGLANATEVPAGSFVTAAIA